MKIREFTTQDRTHGQHDVVLFQLKTVTHILRVKVNANIKNVASPDVIETIRTYKDHTEAVQHFEELEKERQQKVSSISKMWRK